MSKPTDRQLKYLNALVAKVATARDCTEREIWVSLGAYEDNAWGGRLRSEAVTFANVSRWIDTLKGWQ